MTVIVQTVAFWLCHSIVLQLHINISEEDVTSTFKVKVCRVKNQLNYMGQLNGRWSFKSLRGNVYPEEGKMCHIPDDSILVFTVIRTLILIIFTIYN
jgi:hypothetical protein